MLIQHLRGCAAGADPELLAWCRMNARAAAAFDSWARLAIPRRDEPAWDQGAARVAAYRNLLVDAVVFESHPVPVSGMTHQLVTPINPAVCGLSLYLQHLHVDFGAAQAIAFSPGLQLTLGT